MPLDLQLDPGSDVPAYRQLIAKIGSLVRAGTLKAGDQLPAERQLSTQLGLGRGTIAKAYEELARNGILEIAHGRGSFVCGREAVPSGRTQQAVELINALFNDLLGLRFSPREIKALVNLAMLEREAEFERLRVALVECSPEALSLFARQLGRLSRVHIQTILLDDLCNGGAPEKQLAPFELVLTTTTHYQQLLGLGPALHERLVQIVVSPIQETIVSLAGLRPSQVAGIICESAKFLAIVKNKLGELGIANRVTNLAYPLQPESLEAFVCDKDALIVPPGFTAALDRRAAAVIAAFTARGGRIITFDYQIERGSLIYVEERIKNLRKRG